ncbi:MAG: hypothetical protein B5M48_00125 [Candidatus Omnitrophica bacterium 4484_213]|nr:MAG: hypothetical protein B5M48_00125 [Candidatus Omnitrophica bacterium 4484_213]
MRKREKEEEERFLDITANMEGNLSFNDPVNLRINGEFKGNLTTKGRLVIGEKAVVNAGINGEEISVAGKLTGNVKASKKLKILSSGQVNGDVQTPVVSIDEGGILQGRCQMLFDFPEKETFKNEKLMSLKELAEYLELDLNVVEKWAVNKKIPAVRKNGEWVFEKERIDKWVSEEKAGV